MADWLVIGPVANWKLAVKHKIWAVSPRHQKTWEQIAAGDRVFFYATAPVKGLIGWGSVAATAVNEKPFWPDEKEKGHVLWPLEIRFDAVHVLPEKDWTTKARQIERRGIVFQRALQPVAAERAQEWAKEL
ncbi:MAG: hypothetical protein Kow00109_15020 [Acidobacteriota bacterium]